MAASAVDRASQRLVIGGALRAPHGACALNEPPARRIFRFAGLPCMLEKEVWTAVASNENTNELHWQLKVIKATRTPSFVVAARSRRWEKVTGNDLRSLAARRAARSQRGCLALIGTLAYL